MKPTSTKRLKSIGKMQYFYLSLTLFDLISIQFFPQTQIGASLSFMSTLRTSLETHFEQSQNEYFGLETEANGNERTSDF